MDSHNRKNRKTIAFDTNMLLAAIQFKIDIFGQTKKLFGNNIKFVAPSKVFEELEKIAAKKSAKKKKIVLLKEIMKKQKVKKIVVEAQNADACLEKLASLGIVIATNDKALRKKISVFGNHIFLRKGKIIVFE